MSLIVNALGSGHTDTHIPTCEQKRFQETSPATTRTWFKNLNHPSNSGDDGIKMSYYEGNKAL